MEGSDLLPAHGRGLQVLPGLGSVPAQSRRGWEAPTSHPELSTPEHGTCPGPPLRPPALLPSVPCPLRLTGKKVTSGVTGAAHKEVAEQRVHRSASAQLPIHHPLPSGSCEAFPITGSSSRRAWPLPRLNQFLLGWSHRAACQGEALSPLPPTAGQQEDQFSLPAVVVRVPCTVTPFSWAVANGKTQILPSPPAASAPAASAPAAAGD